jgi:3-phosphoshikimate 1-carboxyvinyltransferase
VRFEPSGPLRGSLRPPPDKSISHRAAMLAAMGDGRTEIGNYLDAADARSTLTAVAALGARVEGLTAGPLPERIAIEGVGLRGAGEAAIDVGNAGTLLRILPGWLAGQGRGSWRLDGDESIRRRPIDRVAEPLRLMGAGVRCREDRFAPLEVDGSTLSAIDYELPVASAQVKSCVLLAGLLAEGVTTVRERVPTRDHTERMLAAAGAEIECERVEENGGSTAVIVRGAERLEPGPVEVPGDFSSAAFALVAALVIPGSDVLIDRVGLNPTRTGLLSILERMGAGVEADFEAEGFREPVGTVRARHSELTGTQVGGDEVPLAIDELPLVALAGCFAEGRTVIRGAEELRQKESDRIASVAAALRGLGADVEPTADGLVVAGGGGLRGGSVSAAGDHRIAMMGAVAGLASREGAAVDGIEAAAVSYPGFEGALGGLIR